MTPNLKKLLAEATPLQRRRAGAEVKPYTRHKWTPENHCSRCEMDRSQRRNQHRYYRLPWSLDWGKDHPCYAVSAMAKSRQEAR